MIKIKNGGGEEHLIEQNKFPDGTLNIKNLPPYANSIYWFYENDAELFTIICLRKHYWYSEYIQLIMPYLPHARMDRVKNETENFSLKHFCETINWLNFSEVRILDPHSNVGPALLDRVLVESNDWVINYTLNSLETSHLEKELIAFYPDEGAMKRYSNKTKIPYAFGIKKRNWEDGKILGLDIVNKELVKDKDVLIIDDICSRGGTFLHSAKVLKEAGANKIFLCVTHCENTMLTGEMYKSNLIDHIFTTDSIFTGHGENITVIEY